MTISINDIDETIKLWSAALQRVNKVHKNDEKYFSYIWSEILAQARQHPVLIRDTYKLVISKDNSDYLIRWMNYAGRKNLKIQMSKIINNKILSDETKNDVSLRWKRLYPQDYEEYFESRLMKNIQ